MSIETADGFPTRAEFDLLVQTDPAVALRLATEWRSVIVDDPVSEATALSTVGRALFELGAVERAVVACRRAVVVVEQSDDRELEFSIVMSAAAIFAEAGEIDSALRQLDRIAPGDTPSQRGRLRTQRSYVLHHAGRLAEAIDQLECAEGDLRTAGDELGWLRLLVHRGTIRVQQGEVQLAELDLLEADRVAIALGQSAMRAGIASNLGAVYGRSRRIREALDQFNLAAELHEAAGRPGRMMAVTQIDRAETLMHAGLLVDALAAAESAVAYLEPTGNAVVLGDSQLLLARVQLASSRFGAARRTADIAADLFERSNRRHTEVLARSVSATAALALPGDQQALTASAAIVEQLEASGWQQTADELRLSRLQSARRYGQIEAVRGDLEYLRLGAFSRRRDLGLAGWYAEAVARIEADQPESALDACRAGLNLVDDIVAEAVSLEQRSAAMRLGRDLSGLAIEIAIDFGDARTVLAAAEGTRARALHDERVERHRYRHRPLTVDGAHRLADELAGRLGGAALVEWVISGDTVSAVVFADGEPRLVQVGPLREILKGRDRVLLWLDRAAGEPDLSSEGAMRAIAELDRMLLAPLALPPASRLIVVPVGALHTIPWSGLPTFAGRAVTLTPNAQLWLDADRRAMGGVRTVGLVLGPELTDIGTERDVVESWYENPIVVSGEGATAASVRSMFSELDLVHVAAHGTFRSDHPLLSTLRLADGESTLYDTIPDRMRTRLVVLSSCEGGAHGAADGSEVLGLAAVMLARGAATVLAPLTVVRELECADFVAEVHRHLSRGADVGEAVAAVRQHWLADDDLSRWAVASSFNCFGSTTVKVGGA